jgi:hypothetical protein
MALALLATAFSAHAHQFDPGGKIVVTCQVGSTARMADVAHAVDDSHYWAPQNVRREMLTLARLSCASGATAVTFVPPRDQRYGAAADRQVASSQRRGTGPG